MNRFQLLSVVIFGLLILWTVRTSLRGQMRKRIGAFWMLVWFSSGTTILFPGTTVLFARALGIGRGADLVLYVSVVVSMAGFFYVYTRFRRLDQQLTLLVRALAIQNAHRGGTTAPLLTTAAHAPNDKSGV